MLFVINCLDKPDSLDLRVATRVAHLAYADTVASQIVIAGPLLSDDGERMIGSLFLIEASDLDEARRFSEVDPYRKAGLFGRVEIHPFRRVLPR